MKYIFKENNLDYDIYDPLRTSVGWSNWSKEQVEQK